MRPLDLSHADTEAPSPLPDIGQVSGLPQPEAGLRAERNRPLLIRYGKHLRGLFDWVIARFSLIPNDPVLDPDLFGWTAMLRANWQAIAAEMRRVALAGEASPPLATISPDHRAIAEPGKWRSFFLWGYGYRIDDNADRCPFTTSLVESIPGLNTAFFSILAPGTHIPAHRGVSKGLLTCHLGLVVPRSGDLRMRVADRIIGWREGETLLFDDSYDHEVWNDTPHTRIVLLLQVRRPLRQPGRAIADFFLGIVRRSAFVQEARGNIAKWNSAITALDMR